MRHYEITLMIHPDQGEQIPAMIDRYSTLIKEGGGAVHRNEDWGRKSLSYPINNVRKAHYVLLNIECGQPVLDELTHAFRFNDAIMRNLVLTVEHAITEPSPAMKRSDRSDERSRKGSRSYGAKKTAEANAEEIVE